MGPAERERALSDIINRAQGPSNGQRAAIALRVREYEEHYEMTSEELRTNLTEGRLAETADFSRWMFWYNALGHGE
jgi:hypothetical protein